MQQSETSKILKNQSEVHTVLSPELKQKGPIETKTDNSVLKNGLTSSFVGA